MNLINRLLGGFFLIGHAYTHSRTYQPEEKGFSSDAKNLSGDFLLLGKDLRASLSKVDLLYGQTYPSQSSQPKRKQRSTYPA
ncbi:MAG: hypothetical protein KGQ65_05000 [Burkholderiales bacterium]|nr:hypothetical protein [Burkholderiales bacterium]